MNEKRYLGFVKNNKGHVYPTVLDEIPPKEHNSLIRGLQGNLIEIPNWIQYENLNELVSKYYDAVENKFITQESLTSSEPVDKSKQLFELYP